MRDINRIDKFCNELAEQWKRVPDQRFGQFICNLFGEISADGRDPFFPEEDEMLELTKSIIDRWKGEIKDEK